MKLATQEKFCAALIVEAAGNPAAAPAAAALVRRQKSRLSLPLAAALQILEWGFSLSGWCRRGRPLASFSPAEWQGQIRAWRNSRLGPCRDFLRFHQSLTLLALWGGPPEER